MEYASPLHYIPCFLNILSITILLLPKNPLDRNFVPVGEPSRACLWNHVCWQAESLPFSFTSRRGASLTSMSFYLNRVYSAFAIDNLKAYISKKGNFPLHLYTYSSFFTASFAVNPIPEKYFPQITIVSLMSCLRSTNTLLDSNIVRFFRQLLHYCYSGFIFNLSACPIYFNALIFFNDNLTILHTAVN